MSRGDRDARTLARRWEVLRLPVSPLRRHGTLVPSRYDTRWACEPVAVVVGPDGDALAVWADRAKPVRLLVTRHHGRQIVSDGVVLGGAQPGRFVQPLPGCCSSRLAAVLALPELGKAFPVDQFELDDPSVSVDS